MLVLLTLCNYDVICIKLREYIKLSTNFFVKFKFILCANCQKNSKKFKISMRDVV